MADILTPKQEAFCAAYIETGNASEAYRRAYSVEKMKPETVHRAAKEMLDNPKITARLKELQAPMIEAALLTYESHLKRLAELAEAAAAAGQFSAAITAEVNRGKVAGLYIEKKQVSGPDGGPMQSSMTVKFVDG